jgi:hypothetical protein
MFFKLIRYDLKVGFSTTYKRYLVAIALFVVILGTFLLSVYSFNSVIEELGAQIKPNLGNMLLYAFGGMQEYIPQPGVAFQFPAFWMLSYLLLAYITLYYPFNDLEEFGQNILIRCRGRKLWWFSKCIWNVSSVLCFFLLAWIIFIIGCLLSGCSLSMELSPSISAILKLDAGMYMQFPASLILQTFLLPPLVMIAMNLFQMALSLFIKPFYSFIVTVAVLLTSSYYLSPFFIGNYAMPLRSDQMVTNGVSLTAGIIFSLLIITVSVVVGGIAFQKRDILKREGDG